LKDGKSAKLYEILLLPTAIEPFKVILILFYSVD